jgi:hypothetical protein
MALALDPVSKLATTSVAIGKILLLAKVTFIAALGGPLGEERPQGNMKKPFT